VEPGPGPGESRLATIAGALLVGGARPDAAARRAAAARNARLLASLFEEVLWVGAPAPEGAPGRSVADREGPPCALRGLVGALESAGAGSVLVLAGEAPGVAPDLLLALVAWPEAAAVVPRRAGRAEPLCALYRRDAVLPVARARLAGGRLALHGLLDALETAYLDADRLSGA